MGGDPEAPQEVLSTSVVVGVYSEEIGVEVQGKRGGAWGYSVYKGVRRGRGACWGC